MPAQALPTTDELFGDPNGPLPPQAQTGTKPLPTTDEMFGPDTSKIGPPQSGAAADIAWASRNLPIANVLNAFGSGAADAWGARPLGIDPTIETALKKAGVFNDWESGHINFMKSINEAWMRPVLTVGGAAADAFVRGSQAVFAGGGSALTQAGKEIQGENPNVVQRAVGTALGGAGEISYAAGEGLLGPEVGFGVANERALHSIGQAEMVRGANAARAVGAIGEGDAGFYDAKPITPEDASARTEAAEAAGIEPEPPEPPPADIHELARRIDPDTFEQYDALALEREQHRETIARLGEERENSPEALEAQSQIDTIMGKVRGVESRLTNAARGRLADAQARLDAALRDDTPEMRAARSALLDADFGMRDLAPDVSAAYRKARELMPEPEAPPETAAGAEKPAAEAGAEPAAPTRTPEVEAGVRAASAVTADAVTESASANVMGDETLGGGKKTKGRGKAAATTPAANPAPSVETAPAEPSATLATTAKVPNTSEPGPEENAAPDAPPATEPAATVRPSPAPTPSPGLAQAQADVAEQRSARPARRTIMQAMKELGGMKVRDAEGRPIPGPDVQAALEGFKRKPVGAINNETGLSPERMHEALAEQGWFGHGDIHPEALVRALEKQARGEDVFHPDSGLAEAHARRVLLDEEMTKAGVKRTDSAAVAANKLAHWREVEQRAAERMGALRERADQLGVPHDASMSYDELLHDITEREGISGDATGHGYDEYERDLDDGLTREDQEWLNRRFEEEQGAHEGAFGLSEDWEPDTGASEGDREPVRGATVDSEGAPAFGGRGDDFGVVGTGAERTRGVSATTEARALADGLEDAFGDLPSYNQMSKAAQAARVVADMDRDWEGAVAIAMGERDPPRGVLPESYYEGVRQRAIAMGDFETVRRLATQSRLIDEATTMGRRIGMYAQRSITDPVAAIKSVAKAREAALGAGAKVAEARTVADIEAAIKASAPSEERWGSFLDTIRCAD